MECNNHYLRRILKGEVKTAIAMKPYDHKLFFFGKFFLDPTYKGKSKTSINRNIQLTMAFTFNENQWRKLNSDLGMKNIYQAV